MNQIKIVKDYFFYCLMIQLVFACPLADENIPHEHDAIQWKLTCNTGEELPRKLLDLAAGEWDELIRLKKIKYRHSKEICDDADMIFIIETVSKVDAFVSVFLVVRIESGKNTKLDTRSITVLLDGTDDLDCTIGF